MSEWTVAGPEGPFRARLRVPGDKSLSHRALIMAAMAAGESPIDGLGPGSDVQATIGAIRQLGVAWDGRKVQSPGVDRWQAPVGPIDAGNSGTTMRLLAGALAGRPFSARLVGDDSLMRRPMARLVQPLASLGATIAVSPSGNPPVVVGGSAPLHGAQVQLPLASAQVRTAVALAAVQARGATTVDSPPGFRDHTERWLTAFGRGASLSETAFRIDPGPLPATRYDLPGDPSSAAYLWTAAALVPGALVTVEDVSINPGRLGVLEVLRAMGAHVEVDPTREVHGDPVGTVTVRGALLQGITVAGDLTVRTLDELPLVAVLGCAADGETVVRDAAELRVKESDRIATVVAMVRAVGGSIEEAADGFTVSGGRALAGGVVDAAGDHRIALAASVAAAVTREPITVRGSEAAAVSWPGFVDVLERAWS